MIVSSILNSWFTCIAKFVFKSGTSTGIGSSIGGSMVSVIITKNSSKNSLEISKNSSAIFR